MLFKVVKPQNKRTAKQLEKDHESRENTDTNSIQGESSSTLPTSENKLNFERRDSNSVANSVVIRREEVAKPSWEVSL